MLKPITTSVYTFSNLRDGEFVYVDKTATIRELIRPRFAQYFCARPRLDMGSCQADTVELFWQKVRGLTFAVIES